MQTQDQGERIEVPFSLLKPDPANVRKTDKAPTTQFVASVREEGVLEPLSVRKSGDFFLAFGGSKRLGALAILLKEGAIEENHPVPCILRQVDEKRARDLSLAVNYHRETMHPVDEFEAFADMKKDGMSDADIGKKYGLSKREVEQVLALGNLAPEVREAWRKDEIEEDTARAFTLEQDKDRQADIFKRMKRGHGLHAHSVRRAIIGDDQRLPGMIAFVGMDAYKAAGGTTATDLFAEKKGEGEAVADLKLLTKMYEEKLKTRIEEIRGEGWKWVEYVRDLPSGADWWPSKGKNNVKADDRGKYGVIVKVDYQGQVEFKYGVEKPSAQKKGKGSAGAAKPLISAALCGRLSSQMTRAAAAVLETDSQLALAAIAAALSCHEGPVCITHRQNSAIDDYDGNDDESDLDFDQQLALFRKKQIPELAKVLAQLASTALDLGGHVMHMLPLADDRNEDRGLLEAMDAKKLNAALRERFDAADYFAGVTAAICKEAIQLCDPKYPFTNKEKKSELAKLAAELVKKSNAGGKPGYLPAEMRTAHYDGPAPKAIKAAKPTKAKKAKKAKAAKKKVR